MIQRMSRVLIGLALTIVVACGQELPLSELALAKEQVSRAERVGAKTYASDEFNESKRSLMAANDFAAEEKAGDAKKSADYALSKAYDALEKTLPAVAAKSRDAAVQALDAADEAYASEFSPEEFQKAQSLKGTGDAKIVSADRNLGSYLREEKDELRRAKLRSTALDEFEAADNAYRESASLAKDARTLSLVKSDIIRESAGDVEQILEKASRYSGGVSPSIANERDNLQLAYDDIDAGKLKSADAKIKTSKTISMGILAAVAKDYAKERNSQSADVVEDANSRFSELDSEKLSKNNATRDALGSAGENLGAANESLQASTTLYEQEKYEDSIDQAEEAIRLAEITIDQIESLKKLQAGVGVEVASLSLPKKPRSLSDQILDLGDGWKQYTVFRKNPPECLWRIAKNPDIYNNGRLWSRIYDANRNKIRNQNLIFPKQKLRIPPKKQNSTKSPS